LLNSLRAYSTTKRGSPRRLTIETLETRDVPSYLVTDLGVTAGFDTSYAMSINQAGHVAGYETNSAGDVRAVLWHDGVITDLGSLAGARGIAYAVNDSDQVVGWASALDSQGNPISHAFLWQDGVMTDLGSLGGASWAVDINNAGQVVGSYDTGALDDFGSPIYDTFLWQNGVITDLGMPNSRVASINNAGQVVGTEYFEPPPPDPFGGITSWLPGNLAYRWQAGVTMLLATNATLNWIDPLPPTVAYGINNAGTVVGQATIDVYDGSAWTDGDGWYYGFYQVNDAALWQPDGTLRNLDQGNFYCSAATGINSSGQIIGWAGDADGTHVVTWRNGALIDLATEVPTDVTLDNAAAINDAGQIAANANGHAVLLTYVLPPPTIAITNVTVTEGNSSTTNAVFTVSLSNSYSGPVTVDYDTANGTASAGSDYQAISGTLNFAPGETSRTITVKVIGDRAVESTETFNVNLSGATNATITAGQGVGTILDDEPRISINSVAKYEGRSGQTLYTFTVGLSAAYDQAVTVSYKTTDCTAKTSDHDYVAKTGTLTFNPGETTKTITIVVTGDSKRENDETFFVDLFGNSSNSLIDHSRGIGTILNDD
jgi:probable HAF family extracellular repeat protein